jgi:hypothetical protein
MQCKLTGIWYGLTNNCKGVLVLSTTWIPLQASNVGVIAGENVWTYVMPNF